MAYKSRQSTPMSTTKAPKRTVNLMDRSICLHGRLTVQLCSKHCALQSYFAIHSCEFTFECSSPMSGKSRCAQAPGCNYQFD